MTSYFLHCKIYARTCIHLRRFFEYRLRQAVCGYDRTRTKICCSVDSYSERPIYTNQDAYLTQLSSRSQCGKSLIRNNIDSLGSYPFVARIGFTSKYLCEILVLYVSQNPLISFFFLTLRIKLLLCHINVVENFSLIALNFTLNEVVRLQ